MKSCKCLDSCKVIQVPSDVGAFCGGHEGGNNAQMHPSPSLTMERRKIKIENDKGMKRELECGVKEIGSEVRRKRVKGHQRDEWRA